MDIFFLISQTCSQTLTAICEFCEQHEQACSRTVRERFVAIWRTCEAGSLVVILRRHSEIYLMIPGDFRKWPSWHWYLCHLLLTKSQKSEILPVYALLPYIFANTHVFFLGTYRITILYTERSYSMLKSTQNNILRYRSRVIVHT